jgi:hypothetical protein
MKISDKPVTREELVTVADLAADLAARLRFLSGEDDGNARAVRLEKRIIELESTCATYRLALEQARDELRSKARQSQNRVRSK